MTGQNTGAVQKPRQAQPILSQLLRSFLSPHVERAVARAVAHRQEQVTVERWDPHALHGNPSRHKYDLRWIGAGPVAPPSPQLVRYACKRATRFDQLQLDDRDYQWSM